VNSARALDCRRPGASPWDAAGDLAVWDTDDPRGIAYAIGGAPCLGVVKDGKIVHEAPAPQFKRL
jgi:imidazolonepropionase-like amidohydrolase